MMNYKKIFLICMFFFACLDTAFAQLKIGILLPLMKNSPDSEERKVGEIILKGVKDAYQDYKNSDTNFRSIELIVEDTKRDQGIALELINKFGTDKEVLTVFGPIYSSELANNAGAADFHKIPVITPTATSNDLALKNPYVFQLNPVYNTRGRLIAKYALKELGMKNFLVLSEDTYGRLYSESFIEEIVNSKNIIKGEEYYSKDNPDFKTHLDNFKSVILAEDIFIDFGNADKSTIEKIRQLNPVYNNLDSLVQYNIAVSIYKLFGQKGKAAADSLKLKSLKITDKSKKIIPGIVDAIYLPVSGSVEIPDLLTDIESSGLILPLIGTSDWNNEKLLSENSSKFKTLIIESDFYLSDLSSEYLSEINEEDYKNYYFGYDGMKLILDEIAKGKISRQLLNLSLETLSNYKTNHNNITIKNRSNSSLSILKFNDGKLEKVTDYTY